MGFMDFFSRQARKPSGLFGRWVMSFVFNKGNAEINRMMRECLDVRENNRVLEIGCGTGRLIRELVPHIGAGRIEGVDFSETMTHQSEKLNRSAVADGRVIIHLGNFDEIEFPENSFDRICSANTVYFWSDPGFTARKIYRVLKPGGKLVIAFEDAVRMVEKPISREVFSFYSQEDMKELLHAAGFTQPVEIQTGTGPSSGLCCAVAHK